MGNFFAKDSRKTFTIVPLELGLNFLIRLAHTFLRRDTYMEATLALYESIRSFIVRKDLKIEIRKWGEAYLYFLVEHGIAKKIYRSIPNYSGIKFEKRGGKNGFVHYDGLNEYIEANTKIEALSFDKLDYLFRIYFAVGLVALFVNLAHYFKRSSIFFQLKTSFYYLFRLARQQLAAFKLKRKRRRRRKRRKMSKVLKNLN